ncbi:hypothetical protein HUT03_05065 [Candidatus Liberibacter africanus]|nr:hypothetical protein [Candidatus Liberibacter africanus]QTP64293.1 hypothetical protein HUT03_05065 [Candidatus Liberibacter africanus]
MELIISEVSKGRMLIDVMDDAGRPTDYGFRRALDSNPELRERLDIAIEKQHDRIAKSLITEVDTPPPEEELKHPEYYSDKRDREHRVKCGI